MDVQLMKNRMKKLKINQIELAELSGIPLQTIRSIFCGRTPNPRIDTLKAIESALGIYPGENTGENTGETKKESEFEKMFNRLTEPQKEIILETMRYMCESNTLEMRTKQWRG